MTNLEKYQNAFKEGLDIESDNLENLVYEEIPEWDSVGHMSLIACIEETFDIMMETEDIIDLSSYSKGIEILKKYNIEM